MHKATLTVPQNRTRVPLSKFTNRNNVVLLFLQLQMENRTRLKVQKKRPIKRSGREVLLKKVLDYLKSDTYMYAPLLSPPTSDFPSPNAFPSSAKGLTLTLPFFFLYILVSIAVAFSFLVSFDEVVVACL